MNRREWQEEFDRLFPAGVRVTKVVDVIEDLSDSITLLCAGINVLDADEGQCYVVAFPIDFETSAHFQVAAIEEYKNGWRVRTSTGEDAQEYFLHSGFNELQSAKLADLRAKEIAWWRREHPFTEETS